MKKFLILILFFAIILIIIYSFAQVKLRAFLVEELSKNLKRQVYIGKVGLELPLHAYIKNLIIFEPVQEGKSLSQFLQINEIQVSPAILPFLKGRVLLRSVYIINPVVNITKLDNNKFNFSDLLPAQSETSKAGAVKKEMPFLMLKFRIKNGQVNFVDQTVEGKPVKLALKNLNFYITKVTFPLTEVLSEYSLKARLQQDGLTDLAAINSSGWLNFTKKDMDAKLNLVNLDIRYLQPYYRKALSGEIESGLLNFNSDIVAKNNDLLAKCKLEVNNLKISSGSPPASGILGIPVENILESLKDSGNKLSLDFEIRTRFDRPRIDFAQIAPGVLGKALEKAILKTPQFILNIGEKAKEGGEEGLKDVTEKLKSLGEDLKKVFGQ